jgi:D-alanyl-D-alanine carboxypeptidase
LETGYARYVAALVALLASILLCGAADVRAQETTVEETAPEEPVPPEVAARAWALVDLRSGEYLAGENATDRLPMASTTKIMVALLALEEASLEEEVTVSEEAAAFAVPLYSNVGLLPGDSLSVRELLMATLISSGDDAAYALAEHLGGGSAQHFVERMNRKAVSMGLEDTRFENPIGLDARGHYSSARDLATMTRLALEYPTFRQMVATPYAAVYTQYREIPLANTNDLLGLYPEATGVKTGTTPGAGPSLVASAHSADESYVAVFLDSEEDRFAAAVRNTASRATTARSWSSRARSTPRPGCPTGGARRSASSPRRAWRASSIGAPRWSARPGWSKSCPTPLGRARSLGRWCSASTARSWGRARS